MPNFNHGEFISGAINGVIGQSFQDLELIIVDDGSTDGSQEIISDFCGNDKRITPVFLEKNIGVTEAFNLGYSKSKGDLIIGCASDDYLTELDFFKMAIQEIQRTDCGGAYAICERIWDDGSHHSMIGCSPEQGIIGPVHFQKMFFMGKSFVPGFSAIWKRSCVDYLRGYPEELGPQHDYFINHAIPSIWGCCFIGRVVGKSRCYRDGRNYASRATTEEKIQRHARFEKKYRDYVSVDDEKLADEWRSKLIFDLCGGKDFEKWKERYESFYKNLH